MGGNTSDVETLGLSGCCVVRASAGRIVGVKEDRRRRATVSAPGSSVTDGRCSAVIPEFWVVSGTFGSKVSPSSLRQFGWNQLKETR